MLLFFSKYKIFGLVLLILSIIIISIIYQVLKPNEVLPIFQPAKVNAELVDSTIQHVKKYHIISNFSLINQNGKTITQEDYKNKIYVADFFFTRCTNICITMAYNMSELQEYYKDDTDMMFLSHSVTPEIDSVAVLKKYALNKGIIDKKWNVTTGSKEHIYELARKSYMAVVEDGNGGENDFIHTEQFVLIDKERRIRGYYDGTEKKDMDKLKKDVALLKLAYTNK